MQYAIMTISGDVIHYPKMMVSSYGRQGVAMRFEPVLQISRQSFHYAGARHASLWPSVLRASLPFSAGFLSLIPVFYIAGRVNSSPHDAKGTHINGNTMQRARRAARSDAGRRAGTQLHPARRSRPAPYPPCPTSGRADGASGLRCANKQAGGTPLPVRSHAR